MNNKLISNLCKVILLVFFAGNVSINATTVLSGHKLIFEGNFKCYSNSTNEVFTINSLRDLNKVTIKNNIGQLVYQ